MNLLSYVNANDEVILLLYVIQFQTTPLHCAANNGHTDIVALLIANGADVNMKDKVSCLCNEYTHIVVVQIIMKMSYMASLNIIIM